MLAVAQSEAIYKETQHADGVGYRHGYIGETGTLNVNAQAFLVVRPFAGARIPPHFHDVDQFQVIVDGDGRIGKKPIRPITFQYADAYTPYGPIVGNDNGFAFFTFRNFASGGFWGMPGNRQNMPVRAGRNIEGVFELDGALPAAGETELMELMPAQSDGVCVTGFRLGPGATTVGLEMDGKAQFYLVCAGGMTAVGKKLDRHSVVRLEAGDPRLEMTAGPDGAHVLALQFAAPSERPGTDPAVLAERAAYVRTVPRP